jgi:hypothetical protein
MSAVALLQSVIGTDALDIQKLFDVKGWVIVGKSPVPLSGTITIAR